MAPYSLQQFQPGAKQLNFFIKYWPELNVNQVTKYASISEATVKVYMHAQKSNIRSNKRAPFNKNMDTNIQNPNLIHSISKNEESYDDTYSDNTVTDIPTASSLPFFSPYK